MGQFPTNPSYITRAQTWIPTNSINPKSAWLFENQSGSLGTNLTGSVVYVGTAGTVKVIVAGTPDPEAADALEFKNVAAGTILPVVVDYVLVPSSGAATDIIVGK
tara:strand:- start:984 stop:1298 length:315 start_codon:yes stop_codon:yes gene_type:complete